MPLPRSTPRITLRPFIAFLIPLAVVVMIGAIFPTVFLPKRWLDIEPGQPRSAVHAALGLPDADFSVKGFDGWHNSFGLGASHLTVNYGENNEKVVGKRIETVWGFEYRNWVQDYKQVLKPKVQSKAGAS